MLSKFSKDSEEYLKNNGLTIKKRFFGTISIKIGSAEIISSKCGKTEKFFIKSEDEFCKKVAVEFMDTINPYGTLLEFFDWHYTHRNKTTNPYELHLEYVTD